MRRSRYMTRYTVIRPHICVLLSVIARRRKCLAREIHRHEEINGGPRECEVLCVPWKRDIPRPDSRRTIDTGAPEESILEHARKTHTRRIRIYTPGIRNERQIDSHGSVSQGLIGEIVSVREKAETSLSRST